MRIKAEWLALLHRFRQRELEMVFAGCPEKLFASGLELGAGDGHQSRHLSRYVKSLISTDIDAQVLSGPADPSITYMVCDADSVDRVFDGRRFSLVFSSNLLEHLPDPRRTLGAIHGVLEDEGIMIHVVPNVFWKITHLVFHIPNRMVLIVERLLQPGAAAAIARKIGVSKGSGPSPAVRDNNPGTVRRRRSAWARFLVPDPHGVSPSNLGELAAFRRSRWIRLFREARFDLIVVRRGPVASGYGFGLNRLRRFLERIGLASEYIYIASKARSSSPYARYFAS